MREDVYMGIGRKRKGGNKMIKYGDGTIDARHTVDIRNSVTFAQAIQVNEDGTFENVTYMTDDERTYNNKIVFDATPEEEERYRKLCHRFMNGDRVRIVKGRKMKDEEKIVKSIFNFRPQGTYGFSDVKYLVFTDGTKANADYCIIL